LRPLLKRESRIQSKFKTNFDDAQASSDVLNTILPPASAEIGVSSYKTDNGSGCFRAPSSRAATC
jgi:hypothetical protein